LAKPGLVPLLACLNCGTRHFDIEVTDDQLGRLYADYRGASYFKQRHDFEPWYTRSINDGIGGQEEMRKRRAILNDALADAGVPNTFQSVLDHGGDRGQLLSDLQATRKAVYEISGVPTEAGVESISERDMRESSWDLILSCHVLEHLTNPAAYLRDLVSLGDVNTMYFIEVPNEPAYCSNLNSTSGQRNWLAWLCTRRVLFKLFDFLSTGTRAALHVVPPLMFVPLREHLTFFTISGLKYLLQHNGLTVINAGLLASGHIGIVAGKKPCDVQHAQRRLRVE
jgi:2-polyprenyl-3-methyl-5-hydroxy-6-metoxy-1,4-benzoquinol methylase